MNAHASIGVRPQIHIDEQRLSRKGKFMKATARLPYHLAQRAANRLSRIASAWMMIVTLVVIGCAPITAAVPDGRAAARLAVAGAPLPATASARRLADDALSRLPLRF